MAKKGKKSPVVTVNFDGVEVNGGMKLDDGKYELEVTEVSQETSDNSGEDYLSWKFQVTGPKKAKGKILYYNTSLQKQALWKLRGLLETLGVEVPDDEMELDLEDLVGRTCGCEVVNDKYKGKMRPEIVDLFEVGEDTDDEEDDEPKGKKSKSKDDEDEEEEDEKPAKKKGKKSDDDEEDEEEEKPKKKGKKDKRTFTADSVMELDEDGLQELIDEQELEVDLSDFNQLRRKRAAVVEALEEAGKLDEEA